MGAVRAFRARFATARVFAPLALGSLFAGLVGLADAASPAPSAEGGSGHHLRGECARKMVMIPA